MGLKVDVLVAVSVPALHAARKLAGDTPIVVTDLQTDPVASGGRRQLRAARRQCHRVVSPLIQQAGPRVAAFALKNRLPAISMFRTFADAGGLMAYGPELDVFFRRCAVYVDRILKGTTPADLPIERPTRYEFVINSRTARTLGLALPPSLLLRADKVIE